MVSGNLLGCVGEGILAGPAARLLGTRAGGGRGRWIELRIHTCGVMRWTSTPMLRRYDAVVLSVHTTPLICGSHASVTSTSRLMLGSTTAAAGAGGCSCCGCEGGSAVLICVVASAGMPECRGQGGRMVWWLESQIRIVHRRDQGLGCAGTVRNMLHHLSESAERISNAQRPNPLKCAQHVVGWSAKHVQSGREKTGFTCQPHLDHRFMQNQRECW